MPDQKPDQTTSSQDYPPGMNMPRRREMWDRAKATLASTDSGPGQRWSADRTLQVLRGLYRNGGKGSVDAFQQESPQAGETLNSQAPDQPTQV